MCVCVLRALYSRIGWLAGARERGREWNGDDGRKPVEIKTTPQGPRFSFLGKWNCFFIFIIIENNPVVASGKSMVISRFSSPTYSIVRFELDFKGAGDWHTPAQYNQPASQRKEERNTPSSLSLRRLPWYYKFDLIFSSSSSSSFFLGDTIFFRSLIDTLWGHLANSAIYQVPIHKKKKKRNGEMNREYKWVCTHSPVCAASPCVYQLAQIDYTPPSVSLSYLTYFFTLISFSLPFPNSIRLGGKTKFELTLHILNSFFQFNLAFPDN